MTPKQQQRNSRVVWFEIPVTNLERASRFYEGMLNTSLRVQTFGTDRLALFPYEAPAIGGALIETQELRPAIDGSLVYLNADPSLDEVLARVELNGGKVTVPKVALPEGMGYYARIVDTEGNQVGLHAIS